MSVDVPVSPHQATTDIDEFQTFPPKPHEHTNKSQSPPHIGFLHWEANRQIDRQTVIKAGGQAGRPTSMQSERKSSS